MLNKFKNAMIIEKIPGAVCAMACVASVLMGFAIGYLVFETGEPVLAYADAPLEPYAVSYSAVLTPGFPPGFASGLPSLEDFIRDYNQPRAPEADYLFLVTVLDGYIVVYYSEEKGGELKEITNTSIYSFSLEEQKQLKYGIKIYSEEGLARILQDYGS